MPKTTKQRVSPEHADPARRPNLLVTGGAGYVGSHFVLRAVADGYRVIVVDNLSTGHREFVHGDRFYHEDIHNSEALCAILQRERISAVVHFAASALVGESVQYPQKYFYNNVEGTRSLLYAMKECGIATLVFSSSSAVYGDSPLAAIPEATELRPVNPYGESKRLCEDLIHAAHTQSGFRAAILRYFNVVGQDPAGRVYEKHDPETHIIPNILQAARTSGTFAVHGHRLDTEDGTCIRDFIDVNDLAEVTLSALRYLDNAPWLLSNVGSGQGHSVLETIAICEKALGTRINIDLGDKRAGDPARLVADLTRFREWCPVHLRTLDQSLNVASRQSPKCQGPGLRALSLRLGASGK